MTDPTEGLASAAPQDVQAKAVAVGWVPPDRFKGDPEKFVDAQAFLDHANQVMPILRKNNQQLMVTVTQQNQELAQLKSVVEESRQAIEDLKEFSTKASQEAATRARANLLAELKDAKREGDVDREVEATAALSEMDREIAAAKAAPAKPTLPAPNLPAQPHPDFLAWAADNTWYGKDVRKSALLNAVAQELRQDPAYAGVVGRPFLDLCAAEVAKTLGESSSPGSKTEAGRPTGDQGGGSSSAPGKGKTSRDLPADAKAVCDADVKRFVGNGKAFKTADEWRSHYAGVYFAGE